MTITAADVLAQLQTDQQVLTLRLAAAANPVISAQEAAELQLFQEVSTIVLAAMTAYVASLAPAATAPASAPAPAPAAKFLVVSTPGDVTTAVAAIYVSDTISRKITCTGPVPAQVYHTWKYSNNWVELPDAADGGKVWQDQHNDGQILTLYGCAPGIGWGQPPA